MVTMPVNEKASRQQGFVLIAALIMMALLTLLSLGLYSQGQVDQQASTAVRTSTQGYYYAETAINYLAWSFRNDAEFDSATFSEPSTPSNAANVGDKTELFADLWNPGPTAYADDTPGSASTSGQVMYFDNSPLASRYIVWPGANPVMYHISSHLPRYIMLSIASDGTITASIPSLPHPSTPVIGTDVPQNGAVVWLTAGDKSEDIELDPTQSACSGTAPSDAIACMSSGASGTSASWLSSAYGVVAYAIGYVDGRPTQMIRAVIM